VILGENLTSSSFQTINTSTSFRKFQELIAKARRDEAEKLAAAQMSEQVQNFVHTMKPE
jgi:hypothetical protein